MSQFTKGEWGFLRNSEGTYSVIADDKVIAEVSTGDYGISLVEAEANARLIAYAPELFKYLVQVMNEYDIESNLEGDIMYLVKDINGGAW